MNKDELSALLHAGENAETEAKSAKGGFPDSFWETYSAFANTNGGVILLGVNERKDHSFEIEGLADAVKTEKDFWNMVNNRQKVNRNIMTNHMVHIEQVNGKDILVVEVPRAERSARPVYKGMDPFAGTYRRYGDGDHLCTREGVGAMMRDASQVSMDAAVINEMDMTVFCQDTIRAYRQVFKASNPNHLWNQLEDDVFLRRIKAVDMGEDGRYHPTEAGLLMFGYEYDIIRKFPQYFLDYQEDRVIIGVTRWKDRIISSSGDWSGNVFDFVFRILSKLQSDLKVPFVMKGNMRIDDTPVHKLLREATTNAMVHADYNGRQGIVIRKDEDGFVFANPGRLRISVAEAVSGGVSDPRNSTMLRMFSFIRFGERAGSGLNGIMHVWRKVYHVEAHIGEKDGEVDRTILTLPFGGHEQDVEAMLRFYDDPNEYAVEDFVSPGKNKVTDGEFNVTDAENNVTDAGNKVTAEEFNVTSTQNNVTDEGNKVTFDSQRASYIENKVQNILSSRNSSLIGERLKNIGILASFIEAQPRITQEELAVQMGMSVRTIQRLLNILQNENIIVRVGSKKTGEWIIQDL